MLRRRLQVWEYTSKAISKYGEIKRSHVFGTYSAFGVFLKAT